jgi:hypothetical protein
MSGAMRGGLGLLLVGLAACRAAPPANPEFDDAAKFAFTSFDAEPATLAYALRALETQLYLSLDVEAHGVLDRAVALSRLTEADVAGLERPDRDVAAAVPVALVGLSPHGPEDHQLIQFLEDQTPVEPYSPDHYDRAFLESTETCWRDQGCEELRTWNELTKVNALMSVPYAFHKTFRWVDLNLPDPAELEEGEEPVSEAPRWAFAARSWTTQEYAGENGSAAINQSFTVELWIPRDGGGYLRDAPDPETGWVADSSGGGSLRFLALWHETDIGIAVSDTIVEATTRNGIQDNFDAADDWLTDQLGE